MTRHYEHKQIGYLLIAALGAGLLFIAFTMLNAGFHWLPLLILLLLGIITVTFATLKITINDEYLEIAFGPGFIRKKFPLRDIVSQYPVRNPWYFGWGIHFTPHGLLYNVSGFYAIKLRMKSGKQYLIGTDEPKVLSEAIHEAMERLNK